jgi:glycosyltransferase involved in cell wall biosynthesis
VKIGLVTRHLGLPVGFGTYAGNLMRALAEAPGDDEYVAYAPGWNDAGQLESLMRVRRLPVPRLRSALAGFDLALAPAAAARDRVDVLHYLYPGYPGPPSRRPVVVSVLDAIAFVLPGYELPGPYARLERRSARRADRVLTISESAKDDIARVHGVPPARIDVTYLGAPAVEQGAKEAGDWFLFVGGTERRKGLRSVLEAFASADLGDARLKVVGSHERSALYDGRDDLPDVPGVEWLGHVSPAELDALYRDALALVFPSTYEGFGLPVVEAQARRTPVIATNTSSIPEVVRDAGILVEPGDTAALAREMERVRSDPALRARLADAGVRNVEDFTWERTAAQTRAAYADALRARSSSAKSSSIRSA